MSRIIPLNPSTFMSDPSQWTVPAPKDGVSCGSRVDKALKARITQVVQGGYFSQAFRSESDFVRAAVQWFMDQIIAPKIEGQFLDDQKRATIFIRQQQALERIQAASKFFVEMKHVILTLEGEGAGELAVSSYLEAVEHAESQPEPFRTKVLRLFKTDSQLGNVRYRAENPEELIAVDRKVAA